MNVFAGVNRCRLIGLVLALALASSAGIVSVRRVREQAAVLQACGATETADWSTTLRLTDTLTASGSAGRAAAECRCVALLATDREAECSALLERVLAEPGAESWAPIPSLSVHLVQKLRDEGRNEEAALLAVRAGRRYPTDGDLFYLELMTRIGVEDEAAVLRELSARIDPRGPNATRMRVSVATRHLIRSDPAAALRVLGPGPPAPGDRGAVESWYETRGMALANAGDLLGLKQHYGAWLATGAAPAELQARYALTLSIAGLADPNRSPVELLERALAGADGQTNEHLVEAVAIRLILTLVNADRQNDALAIYDRYHERFAMAGISRAELERSAAHHALADATDAGGLAGRQTVLRFEIPSPASGAQLWLSPGPDEPVDADYSATPVPPSGVVEVQRGPDTAPVRWVYRSAAGDVLASGTADPPVGSVATVSVAPRDPRAPQSVSLTRQPADGHRRVALVVLDCGDWRLVQYLRARGELPVFDALVRDGYRAVLDSDPPLTAAALEALVQPQRRSGASFVGLVHQIGVELAGLAEVGENPFDALSWVLPEATDLFGTIGAGDRTAANLLFSHGGIRAGRHSEVTGPAGRHRLLPVATSERNLDAAERARWPRLAKSRGESDDVHLRTIAAEFDTALEIVRAREVDLLALRIESLDILTHAHFAETVSGGQDDGDHFLLELYRYIDHRLGETYRLLDADDVLIVMSDHGIRTAMEHSRNAVFVATGEGVPAGRAAGRPALRGVSAVIADVLGVETSWPRTGVAPWARFARSTAGTDDS